MVSALILTGMSDAWGQRESPEGREGPAARGNYILQPGDLLRVQVFKEPDLNLDTRVSQDFTIHMPLIGTVDVRNTTIRQLEREVTRRYDADFLVNPQVSINVLQYVERKVNVLGMVNRPGTVIFPQEEPMNLLDAISRAGGFTRLANRRNVRLTRVNASGEMEHQVIDTEDLIRGGSQAHLQILPDDVIYVPERRF